MEGQSADCIGHMVGKARLAARALFQRDIGMPHALYQVEYFLLCHVHDAGAIGAKQLCDLLTVPRSTVSLHLSRLVRRGLVCRCLNERSLRSPLIQLTAKGAKLALELMEVNRHLEDELCVRLTDVERVQLAALLRKLSS